MRKKRASRMGCDIWQRLRRTYNACGTTNLVLFRDKESGGTNSAGLLIAIPQLRKREHEREKDSSFLFFFFS